MCHQNSEALCLNKAEKLISYSSNLQDAILHLVLNRHSSPSTFRFTKHINTIYTSDLTVSPEKQRFMPSKLVSSYHLAMCTASGLIFKTYEKAHQNTPQTPLLQSTSYSGHLPRTWTSSQVNASCKEKYVHLSKGV